LGTSTREARMNPRLTRKRSKRGEELQTKEKKGKKKILKYWNTKKGRFEEKDTRPRSHGKDREKKGEAKCREKCIIVVLRRGWGPGTVEGKKGLSTKRLRKEPPRL